MGNGACAPQAEPGNPSGQRRPHGSVGVLHSTTARTHTHTHYMQRACDLAPHHVARLAHLEAVLLVVGVGDDARHELRRVEVLGQHRVERLAVAHRSVGDGVEEVGG